MPKPLNLPIICKLNGEEIDPQEFVRLWNEKIKAAKQAKTA